MKFNLRAAAVGTLFVAVGAALFEPDSILIGNLPLVLWITPVIVGIRMANGRGQRCVFAGAVGGTLGATLAAVCVGISRQMSFSIWFGPLILIVIGCIGGAVLGAATRMIMEGTTLRDRGCLEKRGARGHQPL